MNIWTWVAEKLSRKRTPMEAPPVLVPTELMARCPKCGKVKKDVDNPRLYANVCECDVKLDG